MSTMKINEITQAVIGAAIEVHRTLGPGLLESVYEECLCQELSLRKIPFERQKELPLRYKGFKLAGGFRIDLLAADQVVVEVKTVESILPIHQAQMLTYMKMGGWKSRTAHQLQRSHSQERDQAIGLGLGGIVKTTQHDKNAEEKSLILTSAFSAPLR